MAQPTLKLAAGGSAVIPARKKTDNFWLLAEKVLPKAITANRITSFRAALFIPIIVLVYTGEFKIAAAIFLTTALLDWGDGAFARLRNQVSKLGKIWDPTADKMDTSAVWLGLLFVIGSNWYRGCSIAIVIIDVLLLLVALAKFLIKDAPEDYWLITWMNLPKIRRFIEVEETGANNFGKIKMVLQSIVLSALLIFGPLTLLNRQGKIHFLPQGLTILQICYPLMFACIIFGCLSFVGHCKVIRFKW